MCDDPDDAVLSPSVPWPKAGCCPSGAVHLWRCLSADETVLTGDEADRARTFKSAEVRAAFVAGRSGIRMAGAHYSGLPPLELKLEIGEHGKPFFRNSRLRFNVSHSRSAVIAAFSTEDVGVDVESRGRCREFVRIAERFFPEDEARRIADSGDEELFLRYWTAKEAMLKLSGEGIANGLEEARVWPAPCLRGRPISVRWFSQDEQVVAVAGFAPFEVKGWFLL